MNAASSDALLVSATGSGLRTAVRTARVLVALLIVLVGGLLLMSVLFGDHMLHSPRWAYWLNVSLYALVPSVLIGLCVPRHWVLAGMTAWGAVLIGLLQMRVTIAGTGVAWSELFGSLAVLFVWFPGVCVLGGRAGAELVRRMVGDTRLW